MELQATTEAGRRFVEIAEKHIEGFRQRAAEHDREGSFPSENFEELRKSGAVADFVPEDLGGLGLDSAHDWAIGIEELGAIVLRETGADRALMQLADEEAFTTKVKVVDFSKARRDLGHDPTIGIEEGIRRYVAWARTVYE